MIERKDGKVDGQVPGKRWRFPLYCWLTAALSMIAAVSPVVAQAPGTGGTPGGSTAPGSAQAFDPGAQLVLEIARTKILPAAFQYAGQLASVALNLKSLGKDPDTRVLDQVLELSRRLETGIESLVSTLEHEDEDAMSHAHHYRDVVLPAMAEVRAAADGLEEIISDDLWPLPTYQEMLFIK